MVSAKYQAAISKSPFSNKPQSLFVTGGYGPTAAIPFAEILTDNGWEEFTPSFPVDVHLHCMVLRNSTTAMVVGGVHNAVISKNTYMISDDKKVKTWVLLK